MKRTWLLAGVAVAVIASLVVWRLQAKAADTSQLAKQQAARKSASAMVSVASAGPKQISQGLDLIGTVESPFVMKLSPKEAGKVLAMNVREGDTVAAGQALAQLDPTQLDAMVLQQQSAVSEARSKLAEAAVEQASNDSGVESAIRQQNASVRSSQADFDQVKATLKAKLQADQNDITDARARLKTAEANERAAKNALDSANANLENAQAKRDRAQKLYDQGYVALQDVEDARTAVRVQENFVKAANQGVASAANGVESAKAQLDAVVQTASVNKRKLEADITASDAKLDQSKASYDAATANRSQRQAYKENLAALRANVANAQAQLAQVQSRRADLVLRSPIKGVVTDRTADPGDVASPGQAVLTVQFLDWLYVTTSAPVDKSPFIKQGQSVQLSFGAFPDQFFNAVIEKVNPAADPQSRQFTFRIKLDNPALQFRPGMFAKVRVTTRLVKTEVSVPREAVKNGSVFVLGQDGKLAERKVKTGIEDSSSIEVLDGLKPGEQVVTLSYVPLRDGLNAKVGKPGGKP